MISVENISYIDLVHEITTYDRIPTENIENVIIITEDDKHTYFEVEVKQPETIINERGNDLMTVLQHSKDYTHVDIIYEDGSNRYCTLPYEEEGPLFNNAFQKYEVKEDGNVRITFSENNKKTHN